jgi:hypothetical protein
VGMSINIKTIIRDAVYKNAENLVDNRMDGFTESNIKFGLSEVMTVINNRILINITWDAMVYIEKVNKGAVLKGLRDGA